MCIYITLPKRVQEKLWSQFNQTLVLTVVQSRGQVLHHTFLHLRSPQPPPMAVGLSAAITPKPFRFIQSSYLLPKHTSTSTTNTSSAFFPLNISPHKTIFRTRPRLCFTVCVIMEDEKRTTQMKISTEEESPDSNVVVDSQISPRLAEKLARKRSERFTYLVAAVMSSFGITSMAVMAVYYRFYWQMEVFILLNQNYISNWSLKMGINFFFLFG